jgi:hypothetical protein
MAIYLCRTRILFPSDYQRQPSPILSLSAAALALVHDCPAARAVRYWQPYPRAIPLRANWAAGGLGFAQGGVGEGLIEILAQEGTEITDPVKRGGNGYDMVVPRGAMRPRHEPGANCTSP